MRKEDTRKFYYIDAMPGAGKTEFFVRTAKKVLTGEAKHTPILIYVAPSIDLLAATFKRLQNAVKNDRLVQENTFVVVDSRGHGKKLKRLRIPVPTDPPTTALNYLFGLITDEEYQETKYKRGHLKGLKGLVGRNQIVMTTHEAFARVNRSDTRHGDFRYLKQMTVIFDEARRCVLQPKEFTIPKDQWVLFFKALDPTFINDRALKPKLQSEDSKWALFDVKSMPPLKEVKTLFNVKVQSMLPAPVRAIRAMFDKYVETGRGSLYVLSNIALKDLYSAPETNKVAIQIVMKPTALFTNYGRVVLTSAFFTDSQMYHFLDDEGHELIDMMRQTPVNPAVAIIKDRSDRLRRAAVQRLHVAPLIKSDADEGPQPNGIYKANLTTHLLTTGMLIPSKLASAMKGKLSSNMNKADLIGNVLNGTAITGSPKLDRQLQDMAVPPLWVLILKAASVFKDWRSEHLTPEQEQNSLLVMNVGDSRVWIPGDIGDLNVVKKIISYGGFGSRLERRDQQDCDSTPPKWAAALQKLLHGPNAIYTVPKSPALHGLNEFSSHRSYTHLVALNPSPTLIKIYRMLVPNYDIDLDHSVEALVQTLYRTNLRDPNGKGPVLMLVPFASAIHQLKQKLEVKQFQCYKWPDLSVLDPIDLRLYSNFVVEQRSKLAQSRQKLKYDPALKPELDRLSALVRAAKSDLRKNPDSKKNQDRLVSRQRDYDHLKERALLKKGK